MNIEKLKSLDREDLLNLVGLESKHRPGDFLLPAITLFGVGMLVGTGVGLLVAPRPGRELRQDIAQRIQDAPEAMKELPQRANDALHRVSDKLSEKRHDGDLRT